MKRLWPLGVVLLVATALRVDAASGTCQAPSLPDPDDKPVEGCAAPQFWMDLRPAAQAGAVSSTAVSATAALPAAPVPAPRQPLPPVGSGAGAPMVMDEGMGRQEIKPDDSQARMMRTAGKAAALRGEPIKGNLASDLNYLQGYADGQVERVSGGVRP